MPVQEDYFYSMVSPSKEIQDFFWISRRGFQITATGLDSFSVELGLRIPIASRSPDFLELYSGFHGQKFPGHRIPLHIATMVRHKLKLELAGEISFLSFYSGVLSTLLLNLSFLV